MLLPASRRYRGLAARRGFPKLTRAPAPSFCIATMSTSSFIRAESARLNIRLSPRLTQDEQLTRILDAMYPGSNAEMTQQRVQAMKEHFEPRRRVATTPTRVAAPATPRAPTKAAALPTARDYQLFAAEFIDHWDAGVTAAEWTEQAMDLWMNRWPAASRTFSRDFFQVFADSIQNHISKNTNKFLWTHYNTWFDSFLEGVRDESARGRPAAQIQQQANAEWEADAAKHLLRHRRAGAYADCLAEVQQWRTSTESARR